MNTAKGPWSLLKITRTDFSILTFEYSIAIERAVAFLFPYIYKMYVVPLYSGKRLRPSA